MAGLCKVVWFVGVSAIIFIVLANQPLPHFRISYGFGVEEEVAVCRIEDGNVAGNVVQYFFVKILLTFQIAACCCFFCNVQVLPEIARIYIIIYQRCIIK